MKPVFTPLVLLAALAGLTFSIPALSDQAQADCDVYEHGDRKPAQSGPCTFSQRQGYIDISLKSGMSFSLSPQGAPDTFTDQNGQQVKRIEADGNLHKYKWKHRLITVYFNGMPAADAGQGENTSSNGPAEWDRGCEDAKGGSYDRSSHTDAYEEGWQSCNNQQESSSDSGPAEWDRGCEDAKGGSYDRSGHSDAYEEGWQACNK